MHHPRRSFRDVARHGLGGLSLLPPPTKNIAPPSEMKPISPFWLMGLCFFNIIFDQLKNSAAGRTFLLEKLLAQT